MTAYLLAAPCKWCGYNGHNYWQKRSHEKNCPWREVEGFDERLMILNADNPPDSPLFLACAVIRRKRGAQYNRAGVELGDYFPFGHASYAQMVHMKATRLRAEVQGAEFNPTFTALEEHMVDLTNYLSFWYDWARRAP